MQEVSDFEISQISTSHGKTSNNKFFLGNSRKIQLLDILLQSFNKPYLKKFRDYDICIQLKKILLREKPDIINVHNIHSAGWPLTVIQTCLKHCPVAWTLHDCWSFLGAYYPTHSPTPTPESNKQIDSFWSSEHPNLAAITPSIWLEKQALASKWSRSEITTIHNPVPRTFFSSKDAKACREALGLKPDLPTIMCIAGNLNEERKGGKILMDILKSNLTDCVQFLLIGKGDFVQTEKIKCLGFVNDEVTIQIAYHASDLLLHPAPIDNLPNTVAESISCGTPVLAFNTGGLPEMILSSKSGWLVEEIDSISMGKELASIISSAKFREIRIPTKKHAKKLFDSSIAGQDYADMFNSIVQSEHT